MTLVVALKWVRENNEGIVISSDSKATVGPVSYETRKVYPIVLKVGSEYVPLAVAGGAGDASIVKQSYRVCEKVLTDLATKEWNSQTPTFEQFEEAVKQVESILIERFKELREKGLEPDFNMILASVSPQGKASIELFDSRGLAEPVHDNPGFAVIGTGFITGGNLLLRILGYSAEESYAIDIGALSTFIIDVVSEIDPAVGPFVGESYYMRVEGGKVLLGPMEPDAIKEFKLKVAKRKELLQLIWQLFDVVGEDKVEAKVEELEKELNKDRSNH
ncbi:MAG: hypothetical protein ACPLZG_13480 [Thermoproteota archaeon]|jgi:hypothetical protein